MSDESLLEAERRTREHGDAASWTRYAVELSRAARDPLDAAFAAMRLDPTSAVRELVPATWEATPRQASLHRAVRWRGLRELGEARRIEHRANAMSAVVDLGGGLVAHNRGNVLVGIDLLEERVVWSANAERPVALVGDELLARDVVSLRWFDRRGNVTRSLELGFAFHEALVVDEHVVALVHVLDGPPPRRRGARTFELVFVDVRTGERGSAVPLSSTTEPAFSVDEGVLVVSNLNRGDHALGAFAFDAQGEQLWQRGEHQRWSAWLVDGRLLGHACIEPHHGLVTLDVRTEERAIRPTAAMGELVCVSEDVLVFVGMRGETMVHDRKSLQLLWSSSDPDRAHARAKDAVATKNALLLVGDRWDPEKKTNLYTIASVEPRTGELLSTRSFHAGSWGSFVLVAGRLVFAADDALVVIG